ncbi:glycosyltransferase family 4 protein [Geomonas sp. Red69]|uniref:Glycosyltransferase family 4 protein n=1 Tax=Geomonas diazotrophica TaxID=2843197 RepID=A0ABX8JKX9_9BACT|nr:MULTISPECIES: glycosyltransferase family 4 protein [Geomonas]MBU5636459.1 glycosyltransferase family 4 protein [Geomonas diazotrophica]QWV99038.1 glycosyltransferase family 4 protein [Geomonas nitrogeniifigens]QXE88204.1 glycosyltransferase family 4 protein [Geomonas nitrogeniifigens]
MKIAFLTPEYPSDAAAEGGLAGYVRKTAAALAQRGCEVWVLVTSDRDARWRDGDVRVCQLRTPRLPAFLSRIPYLASVMPLLQRLLAARACARAFHAAHAEAGFDLVQASSYQAPGYALLGNGAVPVVCRVSSYTPLYAAAQGNKRKFSEYLLDWLELRQVVDADASFSPSRFMADYFERLEAHDLEVVKTPLEDLSAEDDDAFCASHAPSGRYLLYFGTLNRVKGVDLLVQALPGLLARHPDLSVVFIGRDDGGPDGIKYADRLRRSCPESSQRLLFFPVLPKSRLFPFVRRAAAVLVPSRVDNYPNVCLEALQLGTPVIASDRSSLEEMVKDGVNGFLFGNGDADSLAVSVERLLSLSGDELAALRQGVGREVDAIASEDRIGELLAFYRRVIREFKQRREP